MNQMQMDIEQYRKNLHRRMRLCRLLWLAYLLLTAATRFASPAVTEHPAYAGLLGFLAGGLLVALISMAKYRRALKDDTILRRLYNQEHDERMQAIRARAGIPMTLILGAAMIAAGVIATFFSMTVALTLIITALAQLLVSLAVKLWLMHTM
ncbi:MAG: hypothetical protein IKK57_06185 [Clostridia bacterium]|nr:hypothetical protein [Clostridia bacterium]